MKQVQVTSDVPPPGMEKFKSQVNVTFWFWLMYPPRNQNLTKHECYRTKSFQERSSSTFYNLPSPFQYHYLILCLNRKLVNFNFKWIWICGLQPHPTPLSSQKNKMLIFQLHSTSDDQLGWSMDSNPSCHPSPAKKMKCSFLDNIQLLMIGGAGQWTQTPSTTSLQP